MNNQLTWNRVSIILEKDGKHRQLMTENHSRTPAKIVGVHVYTTYQFTYLLNHQNRYLSSERLHIISPFLTLLFYWPISTFPEISFEFSQQMPIEQMLLLFHQIMPNVPFQLKKVTLVFPKYSNRYETLDEWKVEGTIF